MVQPWSLQGHPAVATIHYLFQDLVALAGGVLAQSLDLLGEGVPVARLPLCRDAGVENDPAGGVIRGTVQHLLPSFCSYTNAMTFPVPPQLVQGTPIHYWAGLHAQSQVGTPVLGRR